MVQNIKVREGRIFAQLEELTLYDLAQCKGLSDWTKPRGAVTPIREQSITTIGQEDIVDYQRASKDMAAFTIQARLADVQNWLFSLECDGNFQVLFKDCGDPTNYYGYSMGIGWVKCPPGDLSGEPLAIIEGDNVPIGMSNPMNAIYGPYLIDFNASFLSPAPIADTGSIMDFYFFPEECPTAKCPRRVNKGQYGYAVASAAVGSPTDAANVWFTERYGDAWAVTSENPFAGGEDIGAVHAVGTVDNHRVVVTRGEADGSNPAELAYATVTAIGQTSWVNRDIGSTNGEYIVRFAWPNFRNMILVSNLGRIYKSTDGGSTFSVVYYNAGLFTGMWYDVAFTARGMGYAVGASGMLAQSEDYGATWTLLTSPAPGVTNLTSVTVAEGSNKVFVGAANENVYVSVDNGASWTTKEQQDVDNVVSVDRLGIYDTHFPWSLVTLADGSSRILRSTDGGASFRIWNLALNLAPNNGLFAMAVIDQNRVVVGGAPLDGYTTAFVTRTDTKIDVLSLD